MSNFLFDSGITLDFSLTRVNLRIETSIAIKQCRKNQVSMSVSPPPTTSRCWWWCQRLCQLTFVFACLDEGAGRNAQNFPLCKLNFCCWPYKGGCLCGQRLSSGAVPQLFALWPDWLRPSMRPSVRPSFGSSSICFSCSQGTQSA